MSIRQMIRNRKEDNNKYLVSIAKIDSHQKKEQKI